MKNNSSVYKKVCISVRQELETKCYQHLSNSSDLNPIENIYAYMKDRISKEYSHIISLKIMKDVVVI